MTPAERASLIEDNLPLVRSVLAGVAAHYPRHADREELAQAAALGLVEAAHRYDPERGVPFERWAALRIRGAIVDSVRAVDFATRALRSAGRDIDTTRADLERALGRTPTAAEIAERLGISAEQYASVEGRLHQSLVLSLDTPVGEEGGQQDTLGHSLIDTVAIDPVAVLEQREERRYVRDALAVLPDRLREVVTAYFLDGETSASIAERLQVTESRVSQMRSEALALMRAGITAQYEDVQPPAPAQRAKESSRAAYRQAAYATALAAQSTYQQRLDRAAAATTTVPAAATG
jgi:RNA polymerase sigma factor for flagellar operon FliA